MFFRKKVYPILPTTESDTMTFIQKLDYLEYRLNELNEKVVAAESAISDLETAVEGKSTVSATAESSTLQTLTVDGTTYNVPQGTEVSATDDDGVLQTLTIGDDTYTVPQQSEVTTTSVDLEAGWTGNDAVIERDGHTCVLKIFAKFVSGGDICVIPEGYRPIAAAHAVGIVIHESLPAGVAYVGIQTTGQVSILGVYGTTLQANDYVNIQAVLIC